jgi:hypothetical protein
MPQDFILRLIQQVAQVLASILAFRKAGRMEEAQQAIGEQCFSVTGVPFLLAKNSTPEELLAMMDSGPVGLRCSRKIMMAELLLQDAEIDEATGNLPAAQKTEMLAASLIAASVDSLPADEAKVYREKLASLRLKQVKALSESNE